MINKKYQAQIDLEITKAIALYREKLPITTSDRIKLLNIPREIFNNQLEARVNKLHCNTYSMDNIKNTIQFIFLSLCEKYTTILCLGSPIQENNIVLTVKNLTNKIIEEVSTEKLNITQYFEIEILFDQNNLSLDKNNFNLGINAINIQNTNIYFKSSVAVKQNWNTQTLIKNLLLKSGETFKNEPPLSIFKTISFKEDISNSYLNPSLHDLYRNNEFILQSEVTKEKIKQSLYLAQQYLKNAFYSEKIVYEYNPYTAHKKQPYFIHEWIRVLAATWSIFETDDIKSNEINMLIDVLKKNAILDDHNFFERFDVIDLGTNALITLIEQILKKDNHTTIINSDRPKFLSSFMQDNGLFNTFFKDKQYHEGNEHQLFLPFMAMIALIREGSNTVYIEKIENICLPFYMNFFKKSTSDKQQAMTMWICRVLYELYNYNKNESYINEIFMLCDSLLGLQNHPANDDIDLLGSFTNDFTTCTSAVALETLSIGLILSSKKDRHRYKKYDKAIMLGIRFLLQMQYTEKDDFSFGGFKFSPFNPDIRIDVVQHVIFALNNVLTLI